MGGIVESGELKVTFAGLRLYPGRVVATSRNARRTEQRL